MNREWFYRISFVILGALVAYAGIFLGSIRGCSVNAKSQDYIRGHYCFPVTNVVSVANGGTATCSSTISVTHNRGDEDIYSVHNMLSDELSNWLTIFGCFLTIFGFLVPIGGYLLQARSLREERLQILDDAKQDCEKLLAEKTEEFKSGIASLWEEVKNRIYWQCSQQLQHLRRMEKGKCTAELFEAWLFELILVSELIECGVKAGNATFIRQVVIDFIFVQIHEVWETCDANIQGAILSSLKGSGYTVQFSKDELLNLVGTEGVKKTMRFFEDFNATL